MIFFLFQKSGPGPLVLPVLVASALAVFACAVHAQTDQPASPAATAVEAKAVSDASSNEVAVGEQTPAAPEQAAGGRRIDIGAATGSLLAMQRKSASTRPRPIDGEQASRSYQRYLKSFETAIPEHYSTGLDVKKQ